MIHENRDSGRNRTSNLRRGDSVSPLGHAFDEDDATDGDYVLGPDPEED